MKNVWQALVYKTVFFYASVAQKCLGLSNYYNRLFEKNTTKITTSKDSVFFYAHCRTG